MLVLLRQLPQFVSVLRKVEQASGHPLRGKFLVQLQFWRKYYKVSSTTAADSEAETASKSASSKQSAGSSASSSSSSSSSSSFSSAKSASSASSHKTSMLRSSSSLQPHHAAFELKAVAAAADKEKDKESARKHAATAKITLGELLDESFRGANGVLFSHQREVRNQFEANALDLEVRFVYKLCCSPCACPQMWSSIPFLQFTQVAAMAERLCC